MQQLDELEKLAEPNNELDVIIIGGGITGAGIALDCVLRGFKVALFEKNDFASGTSSRSSKLVHGGLRYLEHYKFLFVMESLRERSVLRGIAPHIVHTLPFLIPIYKGEKPPAILMRMGLWVYDLLSIGRNIGWHSWKNKNKAIALIPELSPDKLKGAGYYFDAQMNDARLCLEVILTAKEHGAYIYNYTEVIDFLHDTSGKINGVKVKSRDNLQEFVIRSKLVINAAGPWGDIISKLENPQASRLMHVSKGTHLLVPKFIREKIAIVVTMKDGRIIFIIPWGKYSLIGTTDTFYDGSIEKIVASKEDVDYLLEGIKRIMPSVNLTYTDIISTFAGVRPLVYSENASTSASSISREDRIVTNQNGLITIVGGKYTTYRKMGKRITDKIVKKFKEQHHLPPGIKKCTTDKQPLYGGQVKNWNIFYDENKQKLIHEFSLADDTADVLITMYGSRLPFLLDIIKENPEWKNLLTIQAPYIQAQVIYAARYEMVHTLSDFLSRRTYLILEKGNGLDCLDITTKLLAKELHWTDQEIKSEIQAYQNLVKANQTYLVAKP